MSDMEYRAFHAELGDPLQKFRGLTSMTMHKFVHLNKKEKRDAFKYGTLHIVNDEKATPAHYLKDASGTPLTPLVMLDRYCALDQDLDVHGKYIIHHRISVHLTRGTLIFRLPFSGQYGVGRSY